MADDPLSMTDHVAREGFLTDAEIQTICIDFDRPPMMSREIQRARYQEADKYVKRLLEAQKNGRVNGGDNNNNKDKDNKDHPSNSRPKEE
jgi:hypothetical protein